MLSEELSEASCISSSDLDICIESIRLACFSLKYNRTSIVPSLLSEIVQSQRSVLTIRVYCMRGIFHHDLFSQIGCKLIIHI